MRVSGRNGPRKTATSMDGRETGMTTPRQSRGSNGNHFAPQQASVEKIRAHDEEDGSDSENAWSRRETARRRQITIGKARPEYRKYISAISCEERQPSHPSTPDPRARVSKRQFDRELGNWRRQLHEFDNVSGSGGAEEAESPSGDSGEFAESPGRRQDQKLASFAERPDRPAGQNRFTRNVVPAVSPEKRGEKKEPDARPPKAVISISLANELDMGDEKLLPPPQTTPFDPSLCNAAMWQWQMAMALPPTTDHYQGVHADPSTPPKHEQGLMADGVTPEKLSREASMWGQALPCFQGTMPEVGKENIQNLPNFAFGANPQQQAQQTMFPQYSAEACQQMQFQQMHLGLFAAPPHVAEAPSAAAEPQAPPAPVAPQASSLTNAPSTPRRGRCNGSFVSGGLSFASPGAPSPLPPMGWPVDTPSPQRFQESFPPANFDSRHVHKEIPVWEPTAASSFMEAMHMCGYSQPHHLDQIAEQSESPQISQSPSLPEAPPPVRIYERI